MMMMRAHSIYKSYMQLGIPEQTSTNYGDNCKNARPTYTISLNMQRLKRVKNHQGRNVLTNDDEICQPLKYLTNIQQHEEFKGEIGVILQENRKHVIML